MNKKVYALFTVILMLLVMASCGLSVGVGDYGLDGTYISMDYPGAMRTINFISDNQFTVTRSIVHSSAPVYYNYKIQGDKIFYSEGEEYGEEDYIRIKNRDKSRISWQDEYDFNKIQIEPKKKWRFGF
ncbi:MAG: hypothetical protein FWD39_01240 [Clostridiales bacterium]|nr:hypothetical protein [Clostridiales bacterium]